MPPRPPYSVVPETPTRRSLFCLLLTRVESLLYSPCQPRLDAHLMYLHYYIKFQGHRSYAQSTSTCLSLHRSTCQFLSDLKTCQLLSSMRTRTLASRNWSDNSAWGLVSCSSMDVNYKAADPAEADVQNGKDMKYGNVTVMICVKNLETAVMITTLGRFLFLLSKFTEKQEERYHNHSKAIVYPEF